MKHAIAIIGMACCYPDADTPTALWENVLAQRRAFRRIPAERLSAADYFSTNRAAPDRTYSFEAALIEGYEFDRVRFHVMGSTFRAADLTHWLALDVAAQALRDARFPNGQGLAKQTAGVVLGNTLTGEFARACGLRLRWPYIRRVTEAALVGRGWSQHERQAFLEELEAEYKRPFPPVGEETLAGGLSNTIAGRICNHFDLKGGGYTVDGACSSSLLAVTTACSSLIAGDVDLVLAGGVDLSLDPFELVGFAKTGALATGEMRVYDRHSNGFWPGEGCGFVVLMRHEDAVKQNRQVYAVIRGWGISSDGKGGITRPEVNGQMLALRRAYARAGFGIETVPYFEGHGTGTAVGDETELKALSQVRREAAAQSAPAAIGSIKANIGHTKAAAGVAGLIKATMALHHQLLPPTTGCHEPHPVIAGSQSALRVLEQGELWPTAYPLRAGVSAMGFGGINTHLVLEKPVATRRKTLRGDDRTLLASTQDAELFLFAAQDAQSLQTQIKELLPIAARLSRAEMGDLAAALEPLSGFGRLRAAIVASSPLELEERLRRVSELLSEGAHRCFDVRKGIFLCQVVNPPRIGFLFPGQGSRLPRNGGALRNRFTFVADIYRDAHFAADSDGLATEVAQPAIAVASLAALRALDWLGIQATVGVGHSLGEITALHWAGAFSAAALLRITTARGKVMASASSTRGAMATVMAAPEEVEPFLKGDDSVVMAVYNAPRQTVISGNPEALEAILTRLQTAGLKATRLPVSTAFHSPLVRSAVLPLRQFLAGEAFAPLQQIVYSTVTGRPLDPAGDFREHLCQQVTSPVLFRAAALAASESLDLWIEVGPNRVLSGIVADFIDLPTIALDAGGPSLQGLLKAAAAAFVLGSASTIRNLFTERFTKPFALNWQPHFLVNPCELAPSFEGSEPNLGSYLTQAVDDKSHLATEVESPSPLPIGDDRKPLEVVRGLVAARTELPTSAISDEARLLSDLHLNSIVVGQLVIEAARQLGLRPPAAPLDFADVTVAEFGEALAGFAHVEGATPDEAEDPLTGVDSWVRAFTVELVECLAGAPSIASGAGCWRLIATPSYPLADALGQALVNVSGSGLIICLPPDPYEECLPLLFDHIRQALQEPEPPPIFLIQHGGGGASLMRTLHLERPNLTVRVIDVPMALTSIDWIIAEIRSAEGYGEAYYGEDGRRWEPVWKYLPVRQAESPLPFGPDDVLVATGGGKGITAECVRSIALQTGVRLVLIGLSDPSDDQELADNLARLTEFGIRFIYVAADVIDAGSMQAAVANAESRFGPVTAILHGAAINKPHLITSMDEELLKQTIAIKVQGLRNLLTAVDPTRLRVLVTFGSIIARMGLPGESHYALANEWMARLTDRFQQEHPECRCLTVEWSVWSGVGMAQRIGGLEALMRSGITPITPERGMAMLKSLLAQRLPTSAIVVTGRIRDLDTVRMASAELPLLRFLEHPRLHFDGIELIADADLSVDADPYVCEHVFHGERLFPAVMGLEAMAQVATALAGCNRPLVFEKVRFARPIIVPESGAARIRIAGLLREDGTVEVAIRSADTSFLVDHFKAHCRPQDEFIGEAEGAAFLPRPSLESGDDTFQMADDLYGDILFHQGRFRRLRRYLRLSARECIAEVQAAPTGDWFGRFLPATMVLGDAAARDAAIHAIQACIPHATVLPVGVDRLEITGATLTGPSLVRARERERTGDLFTYDCEVVDERGMVLERWRGLSLQVVRWNDGRRPWPEGLLAPYLERRVSELLPGTAVTIALGRNTEGARRSHSDAMLRRCLSDQAEARRGLDGKPEVLGGLSVSVAHADDLTLAVAAARPLGCDLERVADLPIEGWRDLLGRERFQLAMVMATETGDDIPLSATRVWTAIESLKKAGALVNAPLVMSKVEPDGWVSLTSGLFTIITAEVAVNRERLAIALAVTVEETLCEHLSIAM